ncbi:hypothetical protein P4S70_07570 [Enterovibrio sp. Hal110]
MLFVRKFFKKEKPRVYLDSIFVVPRGELTSSDEWGFLASAESFEESIRAELGEIFNLPHISTASEVTRRDLGLQVAVVGYRGGELVDAGLHPISVPIFWKPKIEIHSRLFYLDSQKTFKKYKVVERFSWSDFVGRSMTLNGLFFRYKPLYNNKDMENLLLKACFRLVEKMKSSL